MTDLLKLRIADRVRKLRTERGLTQEQVSRAVGVTWRHYQRWEKGESTPYWSNIQKLAEVFGVSPNEIIDPLGTSGSMKKADIEQKLGELALQIADLQARVHKLTMENKRASRKGRTSAGQT